MDKTIKNLILLFLLGLCLSILIAPVKGAIYMDGTYLGSDSYPNTDTCIYGIDQLVLLPTPEYASGSLPLPYYWFVYTGCSEHTSGDFNITEGSGSEYGQYSNGGIYANQYFVNTSCACYNNNRTYVNTMVSDGVSNLHIIASWKWEDVGYVPSIVDFNGIPLSGSAPLIVTFSDASSFTALYNYWNFGDGTTTMGVSPIVQHAFTTAGWYDIEHAATDFGSNSGWKNKSAYIEVIGEGGNGSSSGYSLVVTPESISYGNGFVLSLTSTSGNFTGISEVSYGWEKEGTSNIIYDNLNDKYILDYSLIGNTWYQYDTDAGSFSINKGTILPTPVYGKGNFGVGTYNINAYIHKTTGQVIKVSDTLIITGENQQSLTIEALDYENGYLISGTHINVLDIAKGIWDNRTGGTGAQLFYYPYNQNIYVEATKSGYMDTTRNHTVRAIPADRLYLLMYRGQTPPATNVSLSISVLDNDGMDFIPNAKIQLIPSNEIKYTGASGIATFLVLENTTYQILVSKSGYQSATYILLTFTGGQSQTLIVILNKSIIPTTTIPTPIPTNPSGYTSNLGGNISPATCQAQLPPNSTILDSLKNSMACAGITSGTNQGYGIAIMIIFILGIIGGKYGKGAGVVMGMSSGFVLSLAMGLVPVWTFIAILIFVCLIFAIKLWSAQ